MIVYTLKNCDTCKKALTWLCERNAVFDNHDIRADGLARSHIEPIVETLGWEVAINRRSTTWRGLGQADKENLTNAKAVALIAANPTLMKRPVFVSPKGMAAGFDAKAQAAVETLF